MYNIGDKVVYPMHGAGSIVSIEEKEVMGKKAIILYIRNAWRSKSNGPNRNC